MQGLRILTLLLVLILILTLQLSGDSKAAIDHNNAGITLAKEGRWEKTWTECGEARRLDTQAADTYYRRGLTHADLGQHRYKTPYVKPPHFNKLRELNGHPRTD